MGNPLNFIEIFDPVESLLSPSLAYTLKPDFSFISVFYQQGPFRKIRKEYEKSILIKTKEGFLLPTGLVLKAIKLCKDKKIAIKIIGELEKISYSDFSLKTIVLREEQIRLVKAATEHQRGVLVAPTGEGKTLLGLAVISAFLKTEGKILWLCHTKDLMYQSAKVCKKELGITPGIIGDGLLEKNKKITMATRQSFKNNLDLGVLYDVVIIDETHHITSLKSEYGNILKSIYAPVRIGLTATLPKKDKEAMLAIEGLLGPVIEEITIKEATDLGIMAKIKLRFLKVPMSHTIRDLKKYNDVYEQGVVKRRSQHELIVRTAKKHIEQGDSVLVIVTRIQHGQNILAEFEYQGVKAFFAQGSTEGDVREEIKEALNKKKIHCVIATTIFKEGINIPELNILINASMGKSDIATMQVVGRGLRKTATKTEILVYDIFDPSHPFLISSFGERVSLYSDLEWL